MVRLRRVLFATAWLATAASLAAVAAEPAGRLVVQVVSPEGRPLPQITLTLEGPGKVRRVISGPDGTARIAGLAPGAYTIRLASQPQAITQVTIDEDTQHVEVTLRAAPIREHVVVSATRGPAPQSTLGSTTTVIDRERIESRDAEDLTSLLEEVPGVAVARSGGLGPLASAFVRGGESRFARVLVDGVPVNEPGGFYSFGMQMPLELERIEVVRGASSSLYGSDALAGTILLVTRRPDPDAAPTFEVDLAGGSFDQRRARATTSGTRGPVDWNVGLLRFETDNDQPNSEFEATAGAASFGVRTTEHSELRLVARRQSGRAGIPGPTAFARPDLDAEYDRTDSVVGATWTAGTAALGHQVHASFSRSRQLSRNPEDSGPYVPTWEGREGAFTLFDFPNPAGLLNDTERWLAGYQAEVRTGQRGFLTAGAEVEREAGDLGNRSGELLSPERTNGGVYVQQRVLFGRVFVTAGARAEHNEGYGTEIVPRAAIAVSLRGGPDSTLLRASAGGGIKEPSFFESYSTSPFARGNPDLEPERSRTFDAGIEQRLLAGRLRLEATLFHHDYHDQIGFRVIDPETFEGTFFNLGHTRARGIELAVDAAPSPVWRLGATYTFLDGEIRTSANDFDPVYAEGRPLLRRPRHQGTLSAAFHKRRLRAGTDLVVVGHRADSDFVGLGLESNEGWARLDARAGWALPRASELYLVVENLLDRDYQEILGFPAPGRAVRFGASTRFGEDR